MAKISKPPIPAKLYRHFAVATVLLTACIAMFADGENRQVVEDQLQAQQARIERKRSASKPTLARRAPDYSASPGKFDEEEIAFGQPTTQTVANSQGFVKPAAQGNTDGPRALPGYSEAYLNNLSDEEYRKLVEEMREAGLLDAQERRERITTLERASRARSGKATQAF